MQNPLPGHQTQNSVAGAANALVRIDLDGPLQNLGLPVYAHLRGADAQEYALVITSENQLKAMGKTYRVIDALAAPGSYLLAVERRKGARTLAAQMFSILHDDGRQIVLRNDPALIGKLLELGFDLRVLPSQSMALKGAAAMPLRLSAASVYDQGVADMLAEVLQADVYALTSNLAGANSVSIGGSPYTIATRYTDSGEPIQKATQYAYEYLQNLGLSVSYHDWSLYGSASRNVVATKTGATRPDEIVLITAHLDDMPSSGAAPGADDNASGSAAVMVAARIMASRDFERTIRFVLFSGEEQGLLGSNAYAARIAAAQENIVAVYNMDMIAWRSLATHTLELHTRLTSNPGYPADLAIANQFADVVSSYGLDSQLTPVIVADGESASDHSSFWDNGFAGILAIEDVTHDFNPYYHTPNDKLTNINQSYFTNIIKASLGTGAHLARHAYRMGVSRNGTGSGVVSSTPAGISCGAACSSKFAAGTALTLNAAADDGSVFSGWSGDCSGTGVCQLTMDKAKNVTATFSVTHNLTVSHAGNGEGTITSTPAGISCAGGNCLALFAAGSHVLLEATPTIYSLFSGWDGACSNVSGNCTVIMDSARAVTAAFSTAPRAMVSDRPFSSLQQAYDDPLTTDDAVISLLEGLLAGTFDTADKGLAVTLEGGYNAAFSVIRSETVIQSPVLLRSGTIRMKGINVK